MKLKSFAGYAELSPEQKRLICNGAGASGDWRSKFIPNSIYGLDCTEVFNIHDYCYWIGGTHADKVEADKLMLSNLMEFINSGSKWLRPLRRRRALKYYEAVTIAGNQAFFVDKRVTNCDHVTRQVVYIDLCGGNYGV